MATAKSSCGLPAPFLLAGLFALGIALVAIAVQTVKAATANSIDSLKYE